MYVRGIFTLENAKRYISNIKFIETFQSNFSHITNVNNFAKELFLPALKTLV